jgi:hypothetical protein
MGHFFTGVPDEQVTDTSLMNQLIRVVESSSVLVTTSASDRRTKRL